MTYNSAGKQLFGARGCRAGVPKSSMFVQGNKEELRLLLSKLDGKTKETFLLMMAEWPDDYADMLIEIRRCLRHLVDCGVL